MSDNSTELQIGATRLTGWRATAGVYAIIVAIWLCGFLMGALSHV